MFIRGIYDARGERTPDIRPVTIGERGDERGGDERGGS